MVGWVCHSLPLLRRPRPPESMLHYNYNCSERTRANGHATRLRPAPPLSYFTRHKRNDSQAHHGSRGSVVAGGAARSLRDRCVAVRCVAVRCGAVPRSLAPPVSYFTKPGPCRASKSRRRRGSCRQFCAARSVAHSVDRYEGAVRTLPLCFARTATRRDASSPTR